LCYNPILQALFHKREGSGSGGSCGRGLYLRVEDSAACAADQEQQPPAPCQVKLLHHAHRLRLNTMDFKRLKGLFYEIDFENVDENLQIFGLNKGRGWFLNFPEAPLILK
jgi:hypothetical protein